MISLKEHLIRKNLGKFNAHAYETVDLDLPSGTQWATCNIGADKPEGYGLLFQHGRIDGYKYDDKNHNFLDGDDYVTTSGTEYEKGDTLKPEDDAAYQATKGEFRMPTVDEIDELIDNTDNEWTELNGINGRKFISKKDDSKWIFIPAAGQFYGYDGVFRNSGSHGYIWSSSVVTFNPNDAKYIYFRSDNCCSYCDYRHYGQSVRGVLNK